MILVDTNIVSELMRPSPAAVVRDWMNRQPGHTLFVSAVTLGEVEYGLRLLPEGARRTDLQERFARFVALGFGTRILAYDALAARYYGDIMADRRALGRPMALADGQIAATARAAGMAVATRNTRDFEHCGVALVDPFSASS